MKHQIELQIESTTEHFKRGVDWTNKSDLLITFNMISKLIEQIIKYKSEVNERHDIFDEHVSYYEDIIVRIKPLLLMNGVDREIILKQS